MSSLTSPIDAAEEIAAGLHASEPAFLARFNRAALRVEQIMELPCLRLYMPLDESSVADLIPWAITSASPWRRLGRVPPVPQRAGTA